MIKAEAVTNTFDLGEGEQVDVQQIRVYDEETGYERHFDPDEIDALVDALEIALSATTYYEDWLAELEASLNEKEGEA